MLTMLWSGLAVVGLSLLLSGLLVIPAVLVYESGKAWLSKARARRTSLRRLGVA